ncbi:hypothetical protein C8R48DRAFT_782935 [Suillus tomentosus]|nr:hypothetical protein C8R48DRAFT_782935 [Suillus tomentosus]
MPSQVSGMDVSVSGFDFVSEMDIDEIQSSTGDIIQQDQLCDTEDMLLDDFPDAEDKDSGPQRTSEPLCLPSYCMGSGFLGNKINLNKLSKPSTRDSSLVTSSTFIRYVQAVVACFLQTPTPPHVVLIAVQNTAMLSLPNLSTPAPTSGPKVHSSAPFKCKPKNPNSMVMSSCIANLPTYLQIYSVGITLRPKEFNIDQLQHFMKNYIDDVLALYDNGIFNKTPENPDGSGDLSFHLLQPSRNV